MAIMAGGRYAPELIRTMIRREMVMESPIFQEWVKDAETRARIAGKAEMAQDSICKYLEVRFDTASLGLQQRVRSITDLDELNRIMNSIYTAGTIDDAQAIILGTEALRKI
jgi:hypothetical protein